MASRRALAAIAAAGAFALATIPSATATTSWVTTRDDNPGGKATYYSNGDVEPSAPSPLSGA